MRGKILKVIAIMSLVFLLNSSIVLARGGGGGGSSSGGSSSSTHSRYNDDDDEEGSLIEGIIMFIGVMIGVSIIGGYIEKKRAKREKKIKDKLKEIERLDCRWNEENIRKEITSLFYRFQKAWEDRDIDVIREIEGEALFKNNKEKLKDLIKRNEKNILNEMTLIKMQLCDINYKENKLIVDVKGSSYDYTINLDTREVIRGSNLSKEVFKERWTLKLVEDKWKLLKIKILEV